MFTLIPVWAARVKSPARQVRALWSPRSGWECKTILPNPWNIPERKRSLIHAIDEQGDFSVRPAERILMHGRFNLSQDREAVNQQPFTLKPMGCDLLV